MDKIMSAEDVARYFCHANYDIIDFNHAVSEIRSRDKAIVERCREVVTNTINDWYIPNDGCANDCGLALDDVLRELGGEQ